MSTIKPAEKIPAKIAVKPVATQLYEDVAAGRATRRQVLIGPADGAEGFAMRRFVMGENGGIPLHTNTVEHQQYVLRGRAIVRVGDQEHDVGPDTTLFIPAGIPHSYEVLEAPFEFLCVVPNRDDSIALVEGRIK